MDTRGLDLLSGQVLLHKLLALQSMPQSALSSVSISPDDYFHLKFVRKQREKRYFIKKRHAYLRAEGSGWLHYLLLYWTPLAKRLCKLWFMDCRPAGMFLSRSCPGSDPTNFLNAENILTLFHRLVQNHAMVRWKSPDNWSHSERRKSAAGLRKLQIHAQKQTRCKMARY